MVASAVVNGNRNSSVVATPPSTPNANVMYSVCCLRPSTYVLTEPYLVIQLIFSLAMI